MSSIFSNLFPKKLKRLNFFLRSIIVLFCLVAIMNFLIFSEQYQINNAYLIITALLFLLVIFYNIIYISIPRLRDMGWNPWLYLLVIVPGVHIIFFIIMLLWPSIEEIQAKNYKQGLN